MFSLRFPWQPPLSIELNSLNNIGRGLSKENYCEDWSESIKGFNRCHVQKKMLDQTSHIIAHTSALDYLLKCVAKGVSLRHLCFKMQWNFTWKNQILNWNITFEIDIPYDLHLACLFILHSVNAHINYCTTFFDHVSFE